MNCFQTDTKEIMSKDNVRYDRFAIQYCDSHPDLTPIRKEIKKTQSVYDQISQNHIAQSIHAAAKNGNLNTVKQHLQSGINIDQRDEEEMTALERAVFSGHFEIAKFLIENGANIHLTNRIQQTPLHIAAFHGHQGIVELLLKYHAEINLGDENGFTPLHFAVYSNHKDITALLIEQGAKSLIDFNEFPDLIDKDCLNLLQQTCQFIADHQDHLINTGFSKHHTSLLIWGDHYVLCNRGVGRLGKSSYTAGSFNKDLLTSKIIEEIQSTEAENDEYENLFLRILPAKLQFSRSKIHDDIEELHISSQTTGNCPWANSEGIVLPFLYIYQSKKNRNTF